MIRITSYRLLKALHPFRKTPPPRAMSFAFFIIFRDDMVAASQRTNVHEMIHFLQQLELLFIGQWILYAFFYFVGRLSGKNHYDAYRNNPFEVEAFDNDDDITYLIKRKPYAWLRSLINNNSK